MVKHHSCFRFNVEKAVRFRPSAFKAHLFLIKATFDESGAELYMMSYAERHRKELEHERKVIARRLPRVAKTSKR